MKGISVIIPTYNSQRYIKESIQSVLNQNYLGNLEIIISDDGSSDNTLDIARSFGKKVNILTKSNDCVSQGASGARNRGINSATQEYIAFLDSDDFYLPNHLNRSASILEINPSIGFVFCRTIEIKEELGKRKYRHWTHHHITKNDILNPAVSRGHIVNTNSLLFKKIVFDNVGNFNETYSNGEDSDMWMRISEKYKGEFSNHYGAAYRTEHNINQLTNNSKEKIDDCHFDIYTNAINRYYQFGLTDQSRIFELKHLILHNKYRKNILIYVLKYLCLICNNPIPFIKRISLQRQRLTFRKQLNIWREFGQFTIH